ATRLSSRALRIRLRERSREPPPIRGRATADEGGGICDTANVHRAARPVLASQPGRGSAALSGRLDWLAGGWTDALAVVAEICAGEIFRGIPLADGLRGAAHSSGLPALAEPSARLDDREHPATDRQSQADGAGDALVGIFSKCAGRRTIHRGLA